MSTPKYGESKDRMRPVVDCTVKNRKIQGLVDTGASITVMAEMEFRKIWNNHTMNRLPMPRMLRISGITGAQIHFSDYVTMEIELLGRTITRPVLIVSGLEHTRLVIGYDTIKEEGMVIDGKNDRVTWSEIPKEENWSMAALHAIRSTEIEPKTVAKIVVQPRMGPKTLKGGVVGVCSSAHGSPLLLWDSLVTTDELGRVTLAIANHQIHSVRVKPNDCIGFIHNQDFREAEVKEKTDEFVHSFFGDFGKEPPEPKRGEIEPLMREDREYLLSKMHIKAPSEWRQKYVDLLLRYHDTLSKSKFDLGWSDVVKHKIRMKREEPIFIRQFRVPLHHQEVLKEFVNELLRKGAIRPSRSPYNSPIFCVDKKMPHDAKPGDKPPLRAVLDFRTINLNSMPDRYAMRDVRECLDDVGLEDSDTYSAVDLTSGFWQQSLDEESRQYTAFTVPGTSGGTKYEFCVTPMGLTGSPSSFARMILYILRGVENLICYVDDVLAHNKGHEAHLKTLEELLLRFRKYNIKINVEKTILGASEVQYLGYTLKNGKISPSKDKAQAMRDFPVPRSAKAIREFVGLTNYFRNLVENYSSKAAPLIKLTSPSAKWEGGEMSEEAKAAFEELKRDLTTEPVVNLPKKDRSFKLYTDAALGDSNNQGGLGAMLVQVDKEGKEYTISYASRMLKQHEKNYSAFLLEKAGIVWAIDYWSYYLIGQRFTVVTDHRPLETLGKVHKKTLDRLAEQMLEYDFAIEYKEGKLNVVADALSRNAVICSLWALDENEQSIEVAQREDEETTMIRQYLLNGTIPMEEGKRDWVKRNAGKCHMEAGLVWHKSQRKGFREKNLLFVPKDLRRQIIIDAHSRLEAGHGGVNRTSERCRLGFWWPNLDSDVAEFVKNCEVCQLTKAKKEPPAKLQPLPRARFPNDRCHIDLFGPIKGSDGSMKFVCVLTDAYSKWAEITAIENKEAKTIARVLVERWLTRFSCMNILVSDQGKEFCNQVVKEVCELFDIDKRRTSPFHPETNAQAEVFNKSLINYMRAMLTNTTTLMWESLLPFMQLSYNAHTHRATRESPFFLTYGRDPRLPYLTLAKKVPTYSENYAGQQMRALSEAYKRASENMAEAERIRVKYYNKMTKERNFAPGERVMVYFPNVTPGSNQKFFKRWRVYQVVKTVGPVNLKLRPIPNSGQDKNILVHVNRVRHANQEEIRDANDTGQKEVAGPEAEGSEEVANEEPQDSAEPKHYGGGPAEAEDRDEDEGDDLGHRQDGHEGGAGSAAEDEGGSRQQSQQQGQDSTEEQSHHIPADQVAQGAELGSNPVETGAEAGEPSAVAPEVRERADADNRSRGSAERTCPPTTPRSRSTERKKNSETNSSRHHTMDAGTRRPGEDPSRHHYGSEMEGRASSPETFFRRKEHDDAVKEILGAEEMEESKEEQRQEPSHRNPLTRPLPPSTIPTGSGSRPKAGTKTKTSTKQSESPQPATETGGSGSRAKAGTSKMTETTKSKAKQSELPQPPTTRTGRTSAQQSERHQPAKGKNPDSAEEKKTKGRRDDGEKQLNNSGNSRTGNSQTSSASSTGQQVRDPADTWSGEGQSGSTGKTSLPARRSRRQRGMEAEEDPTNKVFVPKKALEYMTLEEARQELRRVQESAPPRPR